VDDWVVTPGSGTAPAYEKAAEFLQQIRATRSPKPLMKLRDLERRSGSCATGS
jgi:hypothetical protein